MNQIFILESFEDSERKVGKEIFEELEKSHPNISRYFDIEDKSDFFGTIELILEEINGLNLPCYLHIDCHGDEVGIALKNGECIDWEEFREGFRNLYVATKKQLIVCMSACRGYHIAKMVAHFEPCPYYAICGSFEDIGFEESKNGYSAFYQTILNNKSISEAIEEVNIVEPSLKFVGHTADQLFKLAINKYTESLTPQYLLKEKLKKIKLIKKFYGDNREKIIYLNKVYTKQGQELLLNERYRSVFFS